MKKEEIVIEDGTVSWFYGEQVPAGFYWVVLNVTSSFERDFLLDDKWFTAQWQGAILTAESVVKKSSPKFAPQVGASFVQRATPGAYKLKLKCFYSLEEAEKFVKNGQADAGWFAEPADYSWMWMPVTGLSNTKFVQEKKNDVRVNEWPNDSYPQQTPQQRIAQRQVDLNAAKITKLEKELKDLRELQKLLKGLR